MVNTSPFSCVYVTNTFSMCDFPFHTLYDVFQWTEVLNFNGVRLIGPVFMGSAFVSYFKEYFLLTQRSQVVFLWSASSWNLYWLSKMCNCWKHSLTPACHCKFMLAFLHVFLFPVLNFCTSAATAKGQVLPSLRKDGHIDRSAARLDFTGLQLTVLPFSLLWASVLLCSCYGFATSVLLSYLLSQWFLLIVL